LRSELVSLRAAPLAVQYAPARPGDIYHSRSDPSLAKRLIGFQARTDFRSGLASTLQWQQSESGGAA